LSVSVISSGFLENRLVRGISVPGISEGIAVRRALRSSAILLRAACESGDSDRVTDECTGRVSMVLY